MRKVSAFGTFLLSLLSLVFGFIAGAVGYHFHTLPHDSDVLVAGDISIHFLELGNQFVGDCTLIDVGEVEVLIDAGSRNNSATTIINYIDEYVDDKLDYVIATHAHQDHIAAFYSTGSRKGIFETFEVGTIIDFPRTESTTATYNNYVEYRDLEVDAGATHYTALQCFKETDGASRKFALSEEIELEILYNYYYENDADNENDYSVCAMINQGDYHYLFTGDLEEAGELELVNYYKTHGGLPECVLYKAGHHGSGTSSSPELLEMISPEYVCICSCAGTSEYTDNKAHQFPYNEFCENISYYTDKVYVTSVVDNYVEKSKWNSEGTVKSLNGNIVFSVINGEIEVNCSNNNLKLKESSWFLNIINDPTSGRTMPTRWQTS